MSHLCNWEAVTISCLWITNELFLPTYEHTQAQKKEFFFQKPATKLSIPNRIISSEPFQEWMWKRKLFEIMYFHI